KKTAGQTLVRAREDLPDSRELLADLRELIDSARSLVAQAVNSALVLLYWQVGHRIRTDVLRDQRAGYGQQILPTLSAKLVPEYGQGYSPRSLAQTSQRTRYCRPPTAGEHVEQIVFHDDVPRRRPPLACRCWPLQRGEVCALAPGPAPRRHAPPRTVLTP